MKEGEGELWLVSRAQPFLCYGPSSIYLRPLVLNQRKGIPSELVVAL